MMFIRTVTTISAKDSDYIEMFFNDIYKAEERFLHLQKTDPNRVYYISTQREEIEE